MIKAFKWYFSGFWQPAAVAYGATLITIAIALIGIFTDVWDICVMGILSGFVSAIATAAGAFIATAYNLVVKKYSTALNINILMFPFYIFLTKVLQLYYILDQLGKACGGN